MKKLSFYLLLLLLVACSVDSKIKKMSTEEKINKGDTYYEGKKYSKAIPYYSSVVFEKTSGKTVYIKEKLANSYFYTKRYNDAIYEYEDIINLFAEYDNMEFVLRNLGLSYYKSSLDAHYTQEETYSAIEVFQRYLSKYSNSSHSTEIDSCLKELRDKLIEKKYYNGYIYYKILI